MEQSGVNIVNTGCFHITFTDKNPITLSDVYPVGDNQAKTLVPYEFTITNTCETKAAFQVNLEVLNTSTLNRLEYIKVLLNEKDKTRDSKILTQNEMVEPTIENAHLSYLLHSGVLKEKQEKTYEVRMWFDEDTPAIEEVMNKTLESKVSITTSYKVVSNKENMVLTRFDVQEGTLWTDDDPFLLYKDNYEFMKNSEEIIFQDTMNPIEGVTPIDISANQDKSVLAYVEDTDYVKTTIQANGKIVFPNISASFFERMPVYSIVGLYNVDTSNVMDMSGMFADCHNLQNLDLSSFDTSSVIFMQEMFYNCERLHQLVLTNFNTENVNYMYGMFQNCYYLQTLDLSHFDTSEVLDMYDMFNGCEYLTDLNLKYFDTRNVEYMTNMFQECRSLKTLDLSSFNTTVVISMKDMFYGCGSLTTLDISNFDTTNVTDMEFMFFECSSLTTLDVSNFNTEKVTNMMGMFAGCNGLTTLNVSNFDTANVTNMNSMFYGCGSLTTLDISNFDTANVTNMGAMFYDCSNLIEIIYGSNFIHKNDAKVISMFGGCPANKPTHESWSGVL